jgi:MoxR-like ATPase
LSDRRLSVPELSGDKPHVEFANQGFNVIATANLRDRGVSEMSAALKRRFNFEIVPSIGDANQETALVKERTTKTLARSGTPLPVDDAVLEAVVTIFRDLRLGRSAEGYAVEKPNAVMSTAEAVGVASAIALQTAYLPSDRDPLSLVPGYLRGVVEKDEPKDRARLLAYWDGPVKRRADGGPEVKNARLWKTLHDLRTRLEGE